MDIQVISHQSFVGEIEVPADKSLSHRAAIIGALAEGETVIDNFLLSEDCLTTLNVLRQLGVEIVQKDAGQILIKGVGLQGLQAATEALNCNNAGTLMRLLAGVLVAQPFSSTLSGDQSLLQRPMARIVTPLSKMGAVIEGQKQKNETVAPLTIFPAEKGLKGIHYGLPMASAQVKSCLLFAGLYAQGDTILVENTPTRDHTERLLQLFQAPIEIGRTIKISKAKKLIAQQLTIPGDISSAAFLMVGACIREGSHLLIRNVGISPRRSGILLLLKEMGANIKIFNHRIQSNEPIADIEVKYSPLHGITVPLEWVADAIDEFPAFFIAAACAQGETIVRGCQELRVKESDRIGAMAAGLKALQIPCAMLSDGMVIRGALMQSGAVESFGDHRVAMAFTMAALATKQPTTIYDCESIETSFPNFTRLLRQLGMDIALLD